MPRTFAVCLLLVVLVLAVYWQTTSFGFIAFDDPEYVRDNPRIAAGLTADNLRWALTGAYHSNWHPLTWVSWFIDVHVAGSVHPGMMHFTNLLLHAVNALLLFGVLRAMTGLRGFWPSALAAAIFAVHPVHVESVAWISERKDVLFGMFWMLSLWAYALYARRPGVWRYALVTLCFVLGLMSKGMMVTLPGALLLLDFWPLKRTRLLGNAAVASNQYSANEQFNTQRSAAYLIVEKIPLMVLGVGVSVATWWIQRPTGQLEEGVWIPMIQRLSNAALSYMRYLGNLFWPTDLAVLYPNPNLIGEAWPSWMMWAAAIGAVIITLLAIAFRRKLPYVVVGWFWFVGTMVPVIGLVQFGRQSMADRYAYIPFIGLYIALAWSLNSVTSRWPQSRLVIIPAVIAALLACTFAAHKQAALWRDSHVLFAHALENTDRNWVMHRNLAGLLEADNRADEAFGHMDAAIAIFPSCAWLHDNYGAMLARHGQLFEAQQELRRAIELDPNSAQSHINLAIVLVQRRMYDEAMHHAERARSLDPAEAERCDVIANEIRARRHTSRP